MAFGSVDSTMILVFIVYKYFIAAFADTVDLQSVRRAKLKRLRSDLSASAIQIRHVSMAAAENKNFVGISVTIMCRE